MGAFKFQSYTFRRGLCVGPVPSSNFLEILRVKFIMETCSSLQLYNLLSCKWAEKSGLCHSKTAMFIIVNEGNPSLLHSETRIGTIVLLPQRRNVQCLLPQRPMSCAYCSWSRNIADGLTFHHDVMLKSGTFKSAFCTGKLSFPCPFL